jgi:hypothetical protein
MAVCTEALSSPLNPGSVFLLFGNGSGAFTAGSSYLVGANPISIVSNDFNLDGFLDIATGNQLSDNLSVYYGNGLGVFNFVTTISMGIHTPEELVSDDFNSDGLFDIASIDGAGDVQILLMNSITGFTNYVNYTTGTTFAAWCLAKGDFNFDGLTDLATVSQNGFDGELSIISGNGLGGFSLPSIFSYSNVIDPWNLAIGDFNADNKDDVAIVNLSSDDYTIFLNQNCNSTFAYSDTICAGDSVLFFGSYYSTSGSITHTIASGNALGCDSNIVLQLLVDNSCGNAATQVFMTLENAIQTACNEFQFDVYLRNIGTTSVAIRAYEFAINHAIGLGNGGALSVSFLSRDPVLNVLPSVNANYLPIQKQIRGSTLFSTPNSVPLLSGNPIRIATIKVTTSTSFATNFQPSLLLQDFYTLGLYQSIVSCIVTPPGSNFAIVGLGNPSGSFYLQGLSGTSYIDSFTLNHSCPPVSVSNVNACTSYTWPINGVTYTNAGNYVYTTTFFNGCSICTQIDSLYLTFNCNNFILNTKCFIEGYWDNVNGMVSVLANQLQLTTPTACDSIDVELRYSAFPFGVAATTTTVLQQDGTAICNFNVLSGSGNYYVVIRHRNAIETWSAMPLTFNTGTLLYDFTIAASQAYGANMKEVSLGVFALYSGDINQDENIDLADDALLEIGINGFYFGYHASDITGDGNVDLADAPFVDNNINTFIYSNHP